MSPSESVPPLGKYLASADKATRDKAIKSLSIFLSDVSRNVLSKSEMDKLWKGIFYCFWMSDKPLVQQALASELAEILLTISVVPASIAYLQGFWTAIVREWGGIDRLRMDKFYMLVRRFVNATFRLLIRNEWRKEVCDEINAILSKDDGPLCPTSTRVPSSLAYHLADIYMDELDKVCSSLPRDAPEPRPVPLYTVLEPFFLLAARTLNKTTYSRIQSSLFDPLFEALRPEDRPSGAKRQKVDAHTASKAQDAGYYPHLLANVCVDDPSAQRCVDRISLRQSIARKLFDVASDSGTRDANRRKMYAYWQGEDHESDENSGSEDE
ncbi:Nop52-domain-containing protein [Fistulina hepatica ATCC 64428]|nr:Nop52-domain-containing protein [Fistulina hepatica ATCC 64428]